MVRLVEYSASSDDDRNSVVAADARCTDDDGQWSSCSSGELLSSPSDSFSYPMRSPFSDDEDEDYAPSMTSMEEEEEEEVESSSATSSMDTEDSDPDEEQDMDVEPQDTADVADDAEGNEGADEMVQAFHDTNLDNLGNTNHDGTKQGVEHTLGGRDRDAAKPVFYAWGDLQAAFQDAAYTRRSSSVSTTKMAHGFPQPQNAGGGAVRDEQQTGKRFETSGTTSSGGGLEKGEWRAKAAFALGVAGKKEMPTRRRHSLSGATARHHGTGAIPKCSTVLHREQHQSTGHCPTTAGATEHLAATIKMKIAKTSLVGDEPISNVSVPQVEKADFTFGVQQAQVQTPDFTFGKHAPTEYGKAETANGEEACDDTYMNCPRSRCSATAPFNAGNSASTLEKRDNPMEAFDTSGTDDIGLAKVAAQMPSKPDIGCSAFVGNKSPRSESTSEAPASSKFLFGQAYKNHKPGFFAGRKRSELFHSTESATSASYSAASTRASEDLKGANGLAGDFKIGKTGVSGEFIAPPTSFATGVAGPSMFRRNVPRRRKSSPSRPFPFGCPTSSQFVASTSCSNSAPSWTTTAFSQRYDSACAYDSTHHSTAQGKSTTPATFSGNQFAANKNVDAKMAPKTFSNPEPSSSGANEGFGSVFSERAECSTATSCIPPGSGETETSSQSRGPNFRFTEQQAKSMSAPTIGCGFQIGSVDVRRKTRVRPRKSGMFARKHSPRKDAKVGATEPMRSSSFFGSFSASPFSVRDNHGYAQKDAYQRKSGHSFLADPLAARNYQNLSSASPFVPLDGKRSPCTDKATVATEFASAATSTAGSVNGETTQQQGKTCDTNVSSSVLQKDKPSASQPPSAAHQSVFQQNKPGNCLKTQQTSNGATCPAYAGSRRILRAAVRNIGVRKERARSAPVSSGNRPEEGDAEMGSGDELDWREMKRLGGIAYCSKKYREAVEYYRQSIELLDSLLYRGADTYTIEVRTDKARLHANRAASLMMMMQIAEAQRECQRSIEVDATYARAYLRLSRIQVLLGDTANAKANIDTARQLMEKQDDQVSSCDHIDRVSVLKTEAAIKKLTMLQSEIKSNIACGYYKQALMHTESALVLAPKSRKLQVEKARIFLHRRQLDHISKFCTSVVEKQQANSRKSQNPASRGGISTKSLKDEAVDMVTILGIDLGLLWATSLHYQNKVEDASRILDALEVVAPCSSHVIKLKRQWQDMEQLKRDGNARYKEGQYQEAVRHYSEALLIDPQHHEYCAVLYCNRSAAQMGLQRYHTALLDCNEALQRKPKFFRAMLRRARCHDRLKMHHEAVKDYDNYLREQSSDIPVSETANVARERDEAKAAIAKAREEARQREAAKKRAERQQRQQRPPCWEDASQNKSRPYDRYTRGAGTNGGSSKNQSSGDSSGASCAKTETRSRTYYEILAVSRTATSDQIKKSYRKLALSYHPDKSSALSHIELFKEMTAAYNVLSDKSTRDKYDRELIYNKFSAF